MQTIKALLNEYPQLREKLYIRGFLLSEGAEDIKQYPFFDNWIGVPFGNMRLLVHSLQHVFIEEKDRIKIALVGHAMNPFTMETDERQILIRCIDALLECNNGFWEYYNQLTGIFTCFVSYCGQIWILGDPTGIQTVFHTVHNGKLYVSSHTMLLGELLGLEKDPYIEKLIHYRFFPMLGNSLPGDRTMFMGLKRLTPNLFCVFDSGKIISKRFFTPYQLTGKYNEELAQEAGEIIHRTMELISEKWQTPAISMTGGCDSKTTLACTKGLYDKFKYFSYSSSQAEQVDCDAAGLICKYLGLKHTVYSIPETLPDSDYTKAVAKIIRWNCGDIIDINANDVRKRIVLDGIDDFDVEVKSWVSEIGRAYFSKRFNGRIQFPAKPNGRYCTTLYKFFLNNRRLVRETDRVFDEFIRNYYHVAEQDPLPWFEQFFWEYRVPSWNGVVITGEHRYSSDITIPYNNRKLLTILLSAAIEDRVKDTVYSEIRREYDARIDETGVKVTNILHTKRRSKMEDLYWRLHSKIPF